MTAGRRRKTISTGGTAYVSNLGSAVGAVSGLAGSTARDGLAISGPYMAKRRACISLEGAGLFCGAVPVTALGNVFIRAFLVRDF